MQDRATDRVETFMSLVPSLLQAIVRVDGEALVMHVGEKPYVVSPNGQVDLATRGLTFEAVNGIVAQLLPPDALKSLEDVGATQFELPTLDEFPGEHFTVTAARGGDDVWAEIRRRQVPDDDLVPAEIFTGLPLTPPPAVEQTIASDDLALPREEQLWPNRAPAAAQRDFSHDDALRVVAAEAAVMLPMVDVPDELAAPPDSPMPLLPEMLVAPVIVEVPPAIETAPVVDATPAVEEPAPVAHEEAPPAAVDEAMPVAVEEAAPVAVDEAAPVAVEEAASVAVEEAAAAVEEAAPVAVEEAAPVAVEEAWAVAVEEPALVVEAPVAAAPVADAPPIDVIEPETPAMVEPVLPDPVAVPEFESAFESAPAFATLSVPSSLEARAAEQLSEAVMSTLPSDYQSLAPFGTIPSAQPAAAETPRESPAAAAPASDAAFVPFPPLADHPQPAVVLPIGRGVGRDAQSASPEAGSAVLERLLRLAAARGASALYLSSNARPSVRLDGDIQTLDGTAVQSAQDIESVLADAMPDRGDALRSGASSEWMWDLSDVGRVRCTSFRDHRGPGAVLRIVSVRPQSASQLGLSREIQSLAGESEGLILVSGPRSNGKSTLISAFVDLINRTRRDYVITIEHEINVVHERQGAFISQREVRGGSDEVLAAARAALREDPDVLVLEDLRTSALMSVALDAAAAGQLVIGGVPAHHATGAIDRLIELNQPEQRRQVQLSLAQNLRGVVTQVLVAEVGRRTRRGPRSAAEHTARRQPAC